MSDFGCFKVVKTKTEHKCVYCGRTIPKGIMANNYKGMWEGEWQNWYNCQFCEREVVPEYGLCGEGISGDEFNNWFYEQEYIKCKKCENKESRYHNEWDWISPTRIKVECGDCENTWEVEIGFD